MQESAAAKIPVDACSPTVHETLPPAVEWTMDPGQGPLQGPLDLGFFTERTLCLDLSVTQVALLLTREGRLSRLFLEGHHNLPVGTGCGLLSPDQKLIFLDLGQRFRFSWSRSDHLVWGEGAGRFLLGEAAVAVKAPRTFFSTFLAGNDCLDPAFVTRLMAQVVRSALGEVLDQVLPNTRDMEFQDLQHRLRQLDPGLLTPLLEPCGLVCAGLSLYTLSASGEGKQAGHRTRETAGQSGLIRHN